VSEDPRRLIRFWVGFWIAGGFFFWYMDRRNVALCRATRYAFRTEHPYGRAALTTFLLGGALILRRHLLGKR
jgi:hypothetical protein